MYLLPLICYNNIISLKVLQLKSNLPKTRRVMEVNP